MKIYTLYLNRIIKFCFCAVVIIAVLAFGQIIADTAEIPDAEDIIHNGFLNMNQSIDISECGLNTDELSLILNRILKRNPHLFYVSGSFGFSKDASGYVLTIIPNYTMDKAQRAEADEFIYKEIEKILFYMPRGLDDFGKALYFHDYICTHFEYDDSLKSGNIYSMLKNNKGTCQGYAYLYSSLLSAVGVENDFAYSDKIMHIWNLVKLDGEWYHTDVTWDDTEKVFGYAAHRNFLCSDSEIAELGHTDFSAFENIVCNSEKYSGEYLNNINTAFAYLDGVWYVADNSPQKRSIVSYDPITDAKEKVCDIVGYWEMDENKFYANCFSSVVCVGNYIYLNFKNKLLRFDGKNLEEIYVSPNGEQLCYTVAFGSEIYMSLSDSDKLIKVEISPDGDVNGDRKIDIRDLVELSLWLEKGIDIKNKFGADASGDEKLTADDIKILREILLSLTD